MTGLELRDVSKAFGDDHALDSVSFTVRDGEFFTLVGPSGCGKTTTLRIVAGLTEPSRGTVRIDGQSMAGVPPEDRNVGIVFQNYALFPHMTVAENVAYGLKFHEPPRGVSTGERVEELLELVDLSGLEEREPDTLSGGQQQRVALARALAPGPDLLLLDEPMSALDARLRDRLRRTVREIQSELGITTVYVTHDQSEALAASDRIAVMHDGRIEQIGRPEEVYRDPANRFVASFVGDNNLFDVESIDGAIATVDGGATITVNEPVVPGNTLAVRPEAMHVGPGETTLEPTLESAEFWGNGYTLHCRLGDRDLLVETEVAPEEPLEIGFSASDVQVLPDESGG
ncbi:MAG: ABC transporter ATP-binding protein [Halodesulfurarchaeum sp.]